MLLSTSTGKNGMTLNDLEEYKRELLAEHGQEIAAIDRLIARERSKDTSPNGTQSSVQITARVRRRMSLSAMVEAAVKKMTGDFDREQVVQEMQAQNPGFNFGTQRGIGRELWKLMRDGELKTVQTGRGRIPAVYRKK
jgi:hypothetical protein